MKAKISNMRILSGDHTNTKFRREHAKMTLDNDGDQWCQLNFAINAFSEVGRDLNII